MKITVNIDESELEKMITEHIAMKLVSNSDIHHGLKKGMAEGVKNYIYSNKDMIIERVVGRASREIVKKGLPKLLEKVSSDA